MNQVRYQETRVATGATGTTTFYLEKYDQILVYLSAVCGIHGAASTIMRLMGAPHSGVSAKTMYYYDYVNATPAECKFTAATGGVYEFPNPGSMNYLRIEFGAATTAACSHILIMPKTTY